MKSRKNFTFYLIANLDEYQIISEKKLGSGAYGDVYKCIRTVKDQKYECAIKIIKPGAVESGDKFTLEIRSQNMLSDHPAILKLIGYSIPSKQHNEFMVITEFMPNNTLYDALKNESCGRADEKWNETKKAINIIGIAAGMVHCHNNNIIHRDLKALNVLMDENFYPKISDFGLSRVCSNYNMSADVGTTHYMAPELIMGKPYTNSVDVYAYGMILYHILTTDEPWHNKLQKEKCDLMKYLNEGQRPILNNSVQKYFRELIGSCWETEHTLRPTFKEILTDIILKFYQKEIFNCGEDFDMIDDYIESVINYSKDDPLGLGLKLDELRDEI